MLRLIGIVISIGLADALNPSTVAPALYLATHDRPRRAVAQFTAAVFLVSFFGGALIALGPGELVLSLVPKPDITTRHVLEVLAGVVLLVAGALLWVHRGRLRDRALPQVSTQGRAGWLMGATIMGIELPTALPYFAALAAIMGSGVDLPRIVFLMGLYNVCFVLPLVGILAILWLWGERAELELSRVSGFLQRHWPVLLAGVALLAGAITITIGATGTYYAARRLLRKSVLLHRSI